MVFLWQLFLHPNSSLFWIDGVVKKTTDIVTWRFFTRILFRLFGRGGGFGGSPKHKAKSYLLWTKLKHLKFYPKSKLCLAHHKKKTRTLTSICEIFYGCCIKVKFLAVLHLQRFFTHVYLEEKKYISGREIRGFQNLKIFAILCFYLQIRCSAYHWKSHEATFEAKSRFAAHIISRFLVLTMKNPGGFSVLKRVWYLFNQNFPLTIKVYLFAICFLALGQKMVLFATKIPPNTVF